VAVMLNKHGIATSVAYPKYLMDKKDNIIFYIKPIENSYNKIKILAQNNTIILDPLDYIPVLYEVEPGLIDGCIFNNDKEYNDFNHLFKNEKACKKIYHHIDLRFEDLSNKADNLKILYLGCNVPRKVFAYDKFKDIDCYSISGNPRDFKRYKEILEKYNCHYIVNGDVSCERRKYEPFTKLAMASINHSPVITYKEDHIEILGEDYPYYVESKTIEDVNRVIDYIKQTYKTEVWAKAVSIMADAKEKFLLSNTIHAYIDIIKKS
jgi:hypothetical protein